jgi:hypothetical protein|tara:strand:- start:43 stop:222 length:180 start_codon:yes stop_codon:yes gene_type:complete
MTQDTETQFHTIDLFVRSILDDMRNISRSTTKADMMAYMDAWKTELGTIQHIINIDGII